MICDLDEWLDACAARSQKKGADTGSLVLEGQILDGRHPPTSDGNKFPSLLQFPWEERLQSTVPAICPQRLRACAPSSPPPPPPIPPLPPRRRPLPLDRRDRVGVFDDPTTLYACHLEDYAEAWAKALGVSASRFARGDGEHDELYRPRVVALIQELRKC